MIDEEDSDSSAESPARGGSPKSKDESGSDSDPLGDELTVSFTFI